MNIAIFKLINKYFIRSIVGLICLFGVPIFFASLFFAIGEKQFITSFPIIATVGILSATLMIIPTLMIELRKSLILKRIGAAKITKHEFLLAIFLYFFAIVCIAIIWAFILFSVLAAIRPGTFEAWYGKNGKYMHDIGSSIYACFILGTMSILISIVIGMNIKNAMIASAISFVLIFFAIFTSGLLMPIEQVRQISGLKFIGYIIPFDWPILMMEESWGVGTFVSYIANNANLTEVANSKPVFEVVYYMQNDNVWQMWKPFDIFVSNDPQFGTPELSPKKIIIISSLAKGWNIFAPWVFITTLAPILPLTFKWTER